MVVVVAQDKNSKLRNSEPSLPPALYYNPV